MTPQEHIEFLVRHESSTATAESSFASFFPKGPPRKPTFPPRTLPNPRPTGRIKPISDLVKFLMIQTRPAYAGPRAGH